MEFIQLNFNVKPVLSCPEQPVAPVSSAVAAPAVTSRMPPKRRKPMPTHSNKIVTGRPLDTRSKQRIYTYGHTYAEIQCGLPELGRGARRIDAELSCIAYIILIHLLFCL